MAAKKKAVKGARAEKEIVLKNTAGEIVDEKDYFHSDESEEEAKRGKLVPSYFNKMVGFPVLSEELVEIFDKIFDPKDGFLFYKCDRKEVYIVIVPLKYADVDPEHESVSGDFQKHAISFVAEGSVNDDQLKTKLKRVAGILRYEKER